MPERQNVDGWNKHLFCDSNLGPDSLSDRPNEEEEEYICLGQREEVLGSHESHPPSGSCSESALDFPFEIQSIEKEA